MLNPLTFHGSKRVKDYFIRVAKEGRIEEKYRSIPIQGMFYASCGHGSPCGVLTRCPIDAHKALESLIGFPAELCYYIDFHWIRTFGHEREMMFTENFLSRLPIGVDMCKNVYYLKRRILERLLQSAKKSNIFPKSIGKPITMLIGIQESLMEGKSGPEQTSHLKATLTTFEKCPLLSEEMRSLAGTANEAMDIDLPDESMGPLVEAKSQSIAWTLGMYAWCYGDARTGELTDRKVEEWNEWTDHEVSCFLLDIQGLTTQGGN